MIITHLGITYEVRSEAALRLFCELMRVDGTRAAELFAVTLGRRVCR